MQTQFEERQFSYRGHNVEVSTGPEKFCITIDGHPIAQTYKSRAKAITCAMKRIDWQEGRVLTLFHEAMRETGK